MKGGGGGGKCLPSNAHPGGNYLTILCVSLRERRRGESLVSVSCSRLHVILGNRRKKHHLLGKIACQHSPPNYTKTLSYSYER